MRRGVSEGVVVVVRRLGEGWVDRRVGKRRGELTYRLWRNHSYLKHRNDRELAVNGDRLELTLGLFVAVRLWICAGCAQTAFQAALERLLLRVNVDSE